MNNTFLDSLSWSPLYHICNIPDVGILISGQKDTMFFPIERFPLFPFINGERSESEIASLTDDPSVASLFLYQLSILKERTSLFDCSKTVYPTNKALQKTEWLSDAIFTLKKSYLIDIYFFDQFSDYKNFNIDNNKLIFIGFIKGELVASPVLSSTDNIISFFEILGRNMPWNKIFKASDKETGDSYVDATMAECIRNYGSDRDIGPFCQKLANNHNALLSIGNNLKTKEHFLNNISGFNLSYLRDNEIRLTSCVAGFDSDGGFRCTSPEVTVERLQKFVSTFTGSIAYIDELEKNSGNPIKIFSSAFFKPIFERSIKTISNDSFIQTCLGKGVTHSQSQASALCEAIERFSAQYQGNEPLFQSKASELPIRHLDFHSIAQYSDSQYSNFSNPEHPDFSAKQAAVRYNDESIYWLKAWSLTCEEFVYIPLTSCFAGIPFDDNCFGRWNSNGAAAGNTIEEAILQGLFELIERDAVAIWWYNKTTCSAFDLNKIDPEYYAPLKRSLQRDYEYWVLDLTIDTAVPVMAAIGKHKKNNGFVFGFGCHLKPELAAQRALTELCQLIPIRNQNGAPFDFDAVQDEGYLYPAETNSHSQHLEYYNTDIKENILLIISHLKTLNMEVIGLDYSRGFPVNTVKLFIPGMCHIWPQLGNERLYKTPVTMGFKNMALTENNINQQALYI